MEKTYEFFPRKFNKEEMLLYHYSRRYCDDFRMSRQEAYEDLCVASERLSIKPCAYATFCRNVADMVSELSDIERGNAVPIALSVLPPVGTPFSNPILEAVFEQVALEKLQKRWPEYAEG